MPIFNTSSVKRWENSKKKGVWTKSPPDNIPPGHYPRPDIIPARTLSPLVAKFCAKIFMDPDIAFYHDACCVM